MSSKENLINQEPVKQKDFASVQVILTRQNQSNLEVFLVHRITESFYLQWSFPGGKIDAGETPPQAVCREAFEETGVVLDPADLVFLKTGTSQTTRQINGQTVQHRYFIDIFCVNADNLSPFNASPDEHDLARWFTLDQALETHQQAIQIAQTNYPNISPDKIPHALAPRTLEAIKMLHQQN